MSEPKDWLWWVANVDGNDAAFQAEIDIDNVPENFPIHKLTVVQGLPEGKIRVFPWLLASYGAINPVYRMFRSHLMVLCIAEEKLVKALEDVWKPPTEEQIQLARESDVAAAVRDTKAKQNLLGGLQLVR